MGLRMKNFNILWVHWKLRLLGGGGYKKPIQRGDCLTRGLEQFTDLSRGAWQERRGGDFKWGSWYPNDAQMRRGGGGQESGKKWLCNKWMLHNNVICKLLSNYNLYFFCLKLFDFVWYLCWVSFKWQVHNKDP